MIFRDTNKLKQRIFTLAYQDLKDHDDLLSAVLVDKANPTVEGATIRVRNAFRWRARAR